MDSSLFFGIALVMYLAASVTYISYLAFGNEKIGIAATSITLSGLIIQTIALGLRWYEKASLVGFGHIPPLSNMYESMVFWTWCIIFMYLIFERRYKNRTLGAIATPIAFITIAAISIAPNISHEIQPLVPALQSNWLTIHVMTCFVGYAAFAISFGVSIIYLILASDRGKDGFYFIGMLSLVSIITILAALFVDFFVGKITGKPYPHLFAASLAHPVLHVRLVSWLTASFCFTLLWYLGTQYHDRVSALFPKLRVLDDVSYKTVMVGFPMLTIGIITGAAWANYAWGTYWSWDPKETWSLITWFIYAAFLHARLTAGWKGQRTSALSLLGFGAVIFTYIGVNFLLPGLHSYPG